MHSLQHNIDILRTIIIKLNLAKHALPQPFILNEEKLRYRITNQKVYANACSLKKKTKVCRPNASSSDAYNRKYRRMMKNSSA
jgi:hypothetical protein